MEEIDKKLAEYERSVNEWLWHDGNMPSDDAIACTMGRWVREWVRERRSGMDVVASMHCDNIRELAQAMRDAT